MLNYFWGYGKLVLKLTCRLIKLDTNIQHTHHGFFLGRLSSNAVELFSVNNNHFLRFSFVPTASHEYRWGKGAGGAYGLYNKLPRHNLRGYVVNSTKKIVSKRFNLSCVECKKSLRFQKYMAKF